MLTGPDLRVHWERAEKLIGRVKEYHVYKQVIQQVMGEQEQLPSLPAITWEIRNTLVKPNVTCEQLAKLIHKDPSLSALLMKCAASPLYRQMNKVGSLEDVITVLGFDTVDHIVMSHSIKSLFIMRTPILKKLFHKIWQRVLLKAGLSRFLAVKLGYQPADKVLIAALLSQVGALAVLSAFKDISDVPDERIYHKLCQDYSRSLGTILLKKWQLDSVYIEVLHRIGDWYAPTLEGIQLLDLLNLGLYCSVQLIEPENDLPEIHKLFSYKKLPASFSLVDGSQRQLLLVKKNLNEITEHSLSLR